MDALDLIKNSPAPSAQAATSTDAGMALLSKALAPAAQTSPGQGHVSDFVQQYQPVAERIGKQLGVAPETLLGQWGLETGWGKSVIPGTHNLGNIKDFSGKGTKATDNMTGSVDAYRTYDSADAFADDFSSLLTRRYKSAMGSGSDAKRFFAALKANGYAEDPDYVSKGARAAQMAAQALGLGREELPLIPLAASPAEAKAKEGRGAVGAAKDLGIGLAAGVAGGAGALASVFGADNAVARNASEAADWLMKQQTPQRQAERQARATKIQEAEATGSTWDQVVAHVGSFSDAPVETLLGAIGSSAPTLLAAFIPGGQGAAAAWIIRGAQATMGAAQGAGAVKSAIYEAAEKKMLEQGADADTAAKVAAGAQAYDSANGKQIALGAILGAAAGTVGAEAALAKAVNKVPGAMGSRAANAAVSALAEAPTEALQGGQERLASNTALQNLGFDVPTWQGVAGQAALEGVAGAGVGAGMGAAQKSHIAAPAPKPGDTLREAAKQDDSPMAKAAVAAGADLHMDAQAEAMQAEPVAEQTPADPLAERVTGIREMLRNRDVMAQMRDAQTGVSMSSLLGDLATAGSPNTQSALREQALERVETAMYWAGIDPKGIKVDEPTAPAGQALLPHDTVLDVDSSGNVTGVSQRQAQRDAMAAREPFSDVTPVAPGPHQAPEAAPAIPQLTDSSRTITVDSQSNAATADQRSNMLARENQRVREPFTDVTPVPAAKPISSAPSVQLPPQDTGISVDAAGQATTMEQRQAQNNAPRESIREVTPGVRSAPDPIAKTGREATAIRQRRNDLMQQARNGLTTVERRGDRFVMSNPATKQEYWLGNAADAVLARKAVSDAITEMANQANTKPTEGQKKHGNYRKGRVKFEGLNIAIENPVGSVRSGTDPNGERWETPMDWAHYGDLEGTKGADGDAVDVYLAADTRPNVPAYVIDQYNLDGSFDEHKVVMGAFSQNEALRIYDAGFTDGSGPQRRGDVTAMTPAELKAWAKSDATKKPAGKPKAPRKSVIEQMAEDAGGSIVQTLTLRGHKFALLDRLAETAKPDDGQSQNHNFATQQLLEHMAQAFGKQLRFFVTTDEQDGFILRSAPHTIFVNARTQIDVKSVFGHELMHLIKTEHPQVHAALTQAVLERVKDKKALQERYQDTLGYDEDQVAEELVSDVGGDFMRDQDFWTEVFDHLYEQHPASTARKLLRKLLDSLTRLWNKVTKQGKTFADVGDGQAFLDQPEAIRDAFVKAIAGYARDSGLSQSLGGPTSAAATNAANLQNRDRSRAASVAQMQGIASAPDYGRLGISRTPDSGAPMVFATGDKTPADMPTGKQDTATMSDGQRVPFTYAAIEARDLQPSHQADGSINPAFSSDQAGVIKALNNGRSAGIKAAYDNGKAATYRDEMLADAANHGIDAAKLAAMQQPVLVRLYAEKDNTSGMAERSQAQSMGLSATEQAAQDAKLIDASVLAVYEPGDVTTTGNLDFARAFVGKLQSNGQDVSKMMLANGALSSDGATRLRAALVQAAYGDSELVTQLFDRSDSDIQAIGNALRDAAGEWAVMRNSAASSAINPEADATEHLLAALRMVQKQRREDVALSDQVGQVDLETGSSAHPLAVGMLRVLYDGEHFTKARSREAVTQMLRTYVNAAMQTRADGGLLGDVLGAQQIIESLTQGELAHAITPTSDSRTAGRDSVPATPARAEQSNAADSQDAGPARAGERGQSANPAPGQPTGDGQSLLSSYSPDELKARQAEKDAASAKAQADEKKAATAEKQALEQAEVNARMDASAENFELGQSADDAIAGQRDIFAQASKATSSAALNMMGNTLSAQNGKARAAIDSEATAAVTDYLNDSRKHAKREAAKAKAKARDARSKGSDEIAQRYEAAAETYAQVDWADFDRVVKANPEAFLQSEVDPVLIYANLPSAGLRAEVGDMFTPGQMATTASGRQTTPFPSFTARGGLKAVDRWLVDNARREAEARKDDFNATMFGHVLDGGNIQQADKDLAELYLFGDEQPLVVPSILKPLLSVKRKDQSVRLRAIHNLSQENLRFADEMGGLAVPSLAVVTAHKGGVDGFGDITLIATKSMADPRQEPVFTSDAYTATFPKPVWSSVPYPRMQSLYEVLKAMDQEFDGTISHYVWDHTRNHPDAHELISRMEYSATARAMYLREQGKNIKPKMRKQAVPFGLSLAEFKKVLPVLRAAREERMSNGPRKNGESYQKAVAVVLMPYLDKLRSQVADAAPELVQDLIDSETQSFERSIGAAVDGFDRTGFKAVVDKIATDEAVGKQIERVKPEFLAWVHSKVLSMFDAPRLQLGSRKVDYTLPNIVEAMTRARDARGQEKTLTYSEGQVRAASAQQLRNVEHMRELAQTAISDPDEYAQAKEQTGNLLKAWRNSVTDYTTITDWRGNPDMFAANDEAMKAIAKWAMGERTPARLRTLLSKEFKVSAMPADLFTQGVEAGNALLNAPVPYFEAKPQRAVELREFAGAVIPKKASQQTRDILAKAGIPMVEYDSNKPEARRSAVDKLSKRLAGERDDVLFSRQRRAASPEPQPETVDDSASKVLMLAPERLGAMTGKAWDAWLNTQARKQGLDREHLQQLKGSSPSTEPVTASEMAARTESAEQELAQLQALIDDNISQITQELRQQGVLVQTCD